MSSSRISHDSSDVTRQIPFEINPAFFPPPTIPIPINEIKAPVQFNYDFKTEHEAVIRYKKEQESVENGGDKASLQTTIDIISKLSYLPISGSSKPKVQKEQSTQIQEKPLPSQHQIIEPPPSQTIIQVSSAPSSIKTQQIQPSNIQSSTQSFYPPQPQQHQNIHATSTVPVSSSVPIPGASSTYAAGLLPTWTPPQLTLDDFLK